MADTVLLVDSSVWIEALRPRAPEAVVTTLRALLTAQRTAITDMIRLEVIAGAKSPKEFDRFREDFAAIPCLSATAESWQQAEEMSFALGRRGLPVPSTDLLIAAVAISHGVPLWHADRDFERVKQVDSTFKTFWHPHHAPVI